eukprot:CAMPEP_0183742712 /NCGR_PEP_ID=MMETSP0737-20130205/64841_1 /TAXON_ID=385413 /ORGANISM="Thalassiosira miniscula, Strain CCMP1093" /LENGTH=299 /DNA_ID=CAMNT_0025978303 /DNA_START=125 /DNA_END=1024 /DNA_ORIENTATION=-
MKFSKVASSAVLLSAMTVTEVTAFAPSIHTQQPRQANTRLSLLPPVDPVLATSAMESSTIANAVVAETLETLGSLALIGSVGYGVFAGMKDDTFNYEYKVGNELSEGGSDLALMEESPSSVVEKVEEDTKAKEESTPAPAPAPAPASEGGSDLALMEESPSSVVEKVEEDTKAKEESTPAPAPAPAPAAPASVTAATVTKAATPSKKVLDSAEKAKAEVQKVGVQATKEKMSSKTSTSSGLTPRPSPAPVVAAASTEVAETKTPGAKRRVAKGMALIVAAGAVAVARNLVKAYLGRGML